MNNTGFDTLYQAATTSYDLMYSAARGTSIATQCAIKVGKFTASVGKEIWDNPIVQIQWRTIQTFRSGRSAAQNISQSKQIQTTPAEITLPKHSLAAPADIVSTTKAGIQTCLAMQKSVTFTFVLPYILSFMKTDYAPKEEACEIPILYQLTPAQVFLMLQMFDITSSTLRAIIDKNAVQNTVGFAKNFARLNLARDCTSSLAAGYGIIAFFSSEGDYISEFQSEIYKHITYIPLVLTVLCTLTSIYKNPEPVKNNLSTAKKIATNSLCYIGEKATRFIPKSIKSIFSILAWQ